MSGRTRIFEGDGIMLGPGPDFPELADKVLGQIGETSFQERLVSLGTHIGGVIARHVEDSPPDIIQTIANRFGERIAGPPLTDEQLKIFAAGAVNASLIRSIDKQLQGEHPR